jgi:hypothetical protein
MIRIRKYINATCKDINLFPLSVMSFRAKQERKRLIKTTSPRGLVNIFSLYHHVHYTAYRYSQTYATMRIGILALVYILAPILAESTPTCANGCAVPINCAAGGDVRNERALFIHILSNSIVLVW